ncbi:tyrosine-type recombinase/integrase [Sphingomonas crocodyli]|uniref:Site-specific integrase n=1 Tax=Sphingomonas crocodyli TaxID=1979270 RepID=A0A437M7Q4_9SPHN|nr:site-specific integrase [Sphingomonas crocodyli]RVT93748.1 site-specific integrase [Sphingomonas crocodyli]
MPGLPYRIGRLTRTREDGTRYWSFCIKWADERGAHRVSLGTDDRAAAEAAAREFWGKRTLATAETVGEIVTAYLDSLGGLKDEKRKREAWVAAKPFWAGLRTHQIDAETGPTYIEQRQRALNTVRNELGLIRSALAWAHKDKQMIPVMPPVKVPAMPDSEVEHLTKAQFRRFLKGCKAPHVRLFVLLAIATGARSKHLLALPWVRVDWQRKHISLKPTRDGDKEAPNKGRATVPVDDERVWEALKEARHMAQTLFVIESGGERIASIRKGFEAASERSGVKCTPHMLRHSAAVWMAEARTPMDEIAAFLGHKNPLITARVYARFHPDYLRRAAKALRW